MNKIRLVAPLIAVASALALAAVPAAAQPSTFTATQLDNTQRSLDVKLAHPPAGVTSWGLDPTTQRVVVWVVKGDAGALKAARAATTGLPAANIGYVAAPNRTFYNLVGGQAIYTSAGARCSIGFSSRDSRGYTYVITAGHCTELGGTWSGYNQVAIGPTSGSHFPGDDFGTIRDRSTSTWAPTSQIAGTSSVLGSTEAAVGARVCRSGSTTGYRCGTLQAKNQTVNYGNGDIVYGLTRTSACAEPGDSGGSFVAGRQAQGLTSGGSGNCTFGGTTFFQPINEVLRHERLTLVTG